MIVKDDGLAVLLDFDKETTVTKHLQTNRNEHITGSFQSKGIEWLSSSQEEDFEVSLTISNFDGLEHTVDLLILECISSKIGHNKSALVFEQNRL
jgi:hypothetical protein